MIVFLFKMAAFVIFSILVLILFFFTAALSGLIKRVQSSNPEKSTKSVKNLSSENHSLSGPFVTSTMATEKETDSVLADASKSATKEQPVLVADSAPEQTFPSNESSLPKPRTASSPLSTKATKEKETDLLPEKSEMKTTEMEPSVARPSYAPKQAIKPKKPRKKTIRWSFSRQKKAVLLDDTTVASKDDAPLKPKRGSGFVRHWRKQASYTKMPPEQAPPRPPSRSGKSWRRSFVNRSKAKRTVPLSNGTEQELEREWPTAGETKADKAATPF